MERRKKLYLVLTLFLIVTGLFFRLFRPSADLPPDISWSNAITQDATWYTAPAVHWALDQPILDPQIEKNLFAPLFVWWCYVLYLIFGVHYATNTLIATTFGMGCVLLLGVLLFRHLPSSYRYQCTLVAVGLLAYNYTAIAYSRVPVLYTPSAFWILLVLVLWMEGRKRPWMYLVAWLVLFLGVWGIKVIVIMIAPVLLVGHLLLLSEKQQRQILWIILVGSGLAFGVAYWTGFVQWGWNVFAMKISGKPRSLWDWIFHLYTYGSTSRWIFRNPMLTTLAFLYPAIFLLDSRPLRERILEVLLLGWFLAELAGTLFLDQRPLRFLSLHLYPMAGLWALTFAKIYHYHTFPSKRLNTSWRRGWRRRIQPFPSPFPKVSELRFWGASLYLALTLSFLFYHLFAELTYLVKKGFVVGYSFQFNIMRHKYFEACFHLGWGVAMIGLAIWILFHPRLKNHLLRLAPSILGLGLIISISWNLFLVSYHFLRMPIYSQYYASKQLPSLVGNYAHIKGAYAHALALETRLQRSGMFRLHLGDPDLKSVSGYLRRTLHSQNQFPFGFLLVTQNSLLFRFNPSFADKLRSQKVTHVAFPPIKPDIRTLETHFRNAKAPILRLYTFILRGWRAVLLRFCSDPKSPAFRHYFLLHQGKELQKRILQARQAKYPFALFTSPHYLLFIGLDQSLHWTRVNFLYRHLAYWSPRIIANYDNSPLSMFEKGLLYLRTADFLRDLSQDVSAFKLPPFLNSKGYQTLIRKGTSWFQRNEKAYEFTPVTLAHLGECLYRLGMYEEAEQCYLQALRENPYDAQVWTMFSHFYSQWAQRYTDAKKQSQYFRKALEAMKKGLLLSPRSQYFLEKYRALRQKLQNLDETRP